MPAALQIWSATFCRTFDALPPAILADSLLQKVRPLLGEIHKMVAYPPGTAPDAESVVTLRNAVSTLNALISEPGK